MGALACALGPSGRRHSKTDRLFAELFASRLALALDNAGLARELFAAEEERAVMVDSLAEAVTVNAADGSMAYVNDAAVRLVQGESADELLAATPGEIMARFAVYGEDGAPLSLEDLPSVRLLGGEAEAEPLLVRNVVRATGEERWLLHKVSALRGHDGRLLRVINVIDDVTRVKRAERVRTGPHDPAASAGTEPPGALPEDAIAIAGLQAGGQVLGTLTLADSEPFRRFDAEDRALADELGRRAGVALLNARMYQRRTAIAQAL